MSEVRPSSRRIMGFAIERAEHEGPEGQFDMVLATDGEASDGDILHIEGARFPDSVPLQNSHINDAKETLGSIHTFRRDQRGRPKKLRARGEIEMGGPLAAIRQDLAHMVARGHIHAVSVRWNPLKYRPRTSLPKDHYAYVSQEDKDFRKRSGYFHDDWEVLEGSLVAVPADRQAIIGRSEEVDKDLADFYRELADRAQDPGQEIHERPNPSNYESKGAFMEACVPMMVEEGKDSEQAVAACSSMWDEHGKKSAGKAPSKESILAAFQAQIRELTERYGVTVEELADATGAAPKTLLIDQQLFAEVGKVTELERELSALQARLAAMEQDRGNGVPVPPLRTLDQIFAAHQERMDRVKRRAIEAAKKAIAMRRGTVTDEMTFREAIEAEVQALLLSSEEQELAQTLARLEERGSK